MGQFVSTAYDGDPYIDLLRNLPEKELVFWIQKVIWVSAGRLSDACRALPSLLGPAVSAAAQPMWPAQSASAWTHRLTAKL